METKIPKYRVNLSKIEPFFKISDETSKGSFDPTFQSFDQGFENLEGLRVHLM